METNYSKIVALLSKNATVKKEGNLEQYSVNFKSDNDRKAYSELANIPKDQEYKLSSGFSVYATVNLRIKAGEVYELEPNTNYHFETVVLEEGGQFHGTSDVVMSVDNFTKVTV